MRRYYALSFILVLGLILGACGTPDSQDSNGNEEKSGETSGKNNDGDEGKDSELANGTDTVINSVEQLDASLEDSADVSTINEKGKTLEEDWDKIEKKVEKQFPDQYTKIEESLYPLIDEAKKDKPDLEKMKEWTQSTLESLNELKQNIETQ
ncbi:hypothetical protein [Virgibacillus sp. L01]|uniref:hypothetical protein n=1 Tax=Virgibacillus sp. L01 TaxID=3457429 RepID=UPI003FD58D64